jgi:uroporphyrin-III C-methyltransferase/precorrin-2 dehydrogenase/sirohydrochlorin ferrochelatase
LTAAGLPQATPIAIASAVSRPGEKTWEGNLADLASGMTGFDLSQPIIIGVGKVFSSRSRAVEELAQSLVAG